MTTITGFPRYYYENGKVYRKAYKTRSKTCKWQYRKCRELKLTKKDGAKGYFLNNKFISLKKLCSRFVVCNNLHTTN